MAHSKRYPGVEPAAIEAFLVLLRVASDVLDSLDRFLNQEHNLSQGRFTVLMILNRNPEVGLSPSDLAVRAGVTRATMTGLLDGLERESLILRTQHTEDRRMVTVRLTEQGTQRLAAMLPDYFVRIGTLMAGLGEREQAAVTEHLRNIQGRVESFDRNGKLAAAAPAGRG
ncbi:MAG: MarR family transcriptional regulator [Phycisphaerales bacterium]|nr:MarR family transcriptional regulator [Phycisphaerales bacterium]